MSELFAFENEHSVMMKKFEKHVKINNNKLQHNFRGDFLLNFAFTMKDNKIRQNVIVLVLSSFECEEIVQNMKKDIKFEEEAKFQIQEFHSTNFLFNKKLCFVGEVDRKV